MVKQETATVRSFDSYTGDHPGYFYPVEAHGVADGAASYKSHEGEAPAYDFADFHRPDATDVLYGLHSERNFSSSDWYGESGKWSFEVKSYQAENTSSWSYISADWRHESSPFSQEEGHEGLAQPWLGSAKEESFRVSEWTYEESDWTYVSSQWKPEPETHHGIAAAQDYRNDAQSHEFSFDVFARGSIDSSGLLETFTDYDSGDYWS